MYVFRLAVIEDEQSLLLVVALQKWLFMAFAYEYTYQAVNTESWL